MGARGRGHEVDSYSNLLGWEEWEPITFTQVPVKFCTLRPERAGAVCQVTLDPAARLLSPWEKLQHSACILILRMRTCIFDQRF